MYQQTSVGVSLFFCFAGVPAKQGCNKVKKIFKLWHKEISNIFILFHLPQSHAIGNKFFVSSRY